MVIRVILFVLAAIAVCVSAGCTNQEVRREWRTFTPLEKTAWLNAFKCLSTKPGSKTFKPSQSPESAGVPPHNPKGSFFDDVVYLHMEQTVKLHNTGFFLPWHRYFVAQVGKQLKDQCGYKGVMPYWDWTKDSKDLQHSNLFDPLLGAFGDPKDDFQMKTGLLASGFNLIYPSPHRLRRNFTLQPFLGPPAGFWPNPPQLANTSLLLSDVNKAVNGFTGNFTAFQIFVEAKQGMHTAPHLMIGGDLAGSCPTNAPKTCIPGPKWSVNDPMFFMLHAMVDKVWSDWQKKCPSNANAFAGGATQNFDNNGDAPALCKDSQLPVDGLFPPASIGEVMSTTGPKLCYIYK